MVVESGYTKQEIVRLYIPLIKNPVALQAAGQRRLLARALPAALPPPPMAASAARTRLLTPCSHRESGRLTSTRSSTGC